MSHKLWFCLYKDDTQTWKTEGIPYDLGKPEDDRLRLGPFRTKRACNYVVSRGFMVGTVDEIELAAKLEENSELPTPGVVEKLLTVGDTFNLPVSLLTPKTVPSISAPFCEDVPNEVSSSFMASVVRSMMD